METQSGEDDNVSTCCSPTYIIRQEDGKVEVYDELDRQQKNANENSEGDVERLWNELLQTRKARDLYRKKYQDSFSQNNFLKKQADMRSEANHRCSLLDQRSDIFFSEYKTITKRATKCLELYKKLYNMRQTKTKIANSCDEGFYTILSEESGYLNVDSEANKIGFSFKKASLLVLTLINTQLEDTMQNVSFMVRLWMLGIIKRLRKMMSESQNGQWRIGVIELVDPNMLKESQTSISEESLYIVVDRYSNCHVKKLSSIKYFDTEHIFFIFIWGTAAAETCKEAVVYHFLTDKVVDFGSHDLNHKRFILTPLADHLPNWIAGGCERECPILDLLKCM